MQVTGRRSGWSWRWFVPALAPALIGMLFLVLGHPERAAVLWVISGIVLVLVFAGVPVDEYIARFAAAVAHGFGVMATGFVGLVLIAGGGVTRLFRRDPLTPKARRGNGWHPAAESGAIERLTTAPFGIEHASASEVGARSGVWALGRSLALALGTVTAVLLVDLGLGLAWERVSSEESLGGVIVDAVNVTGRTDTIADSRADLPAMAAYPWADEYLREVQQTPVSYWPFTESRPREFVGKYVTIEGWSRASYVPPDLDPNAPVVWMFGGSTTWGEGQRDEYTIASHLARIAEREGTPIRVVNYGQRGWTHFQEMILFEQLLAEGPPPDVAMFYDGANEVNAQSLSAKGVPTHTFADQYAEALTGAAIASEFAPDDSPAAGPSAARVAWDAYLEHSAIRKAVGRIRDTLDPAAGATTVDQSDGDGDAGEGTNYVKTVDDAVRAIDVYERGRSITEFLAGQYDVTPVFFWQPVRAGEADIWANENVSDPTINISDALDDHLEVYIDGGHTNEEGARVVAERIWSEIEPTIADLYRG